MLKMSAVPDATHSMYYQCPDISQFGAHVVHNASDMELWSYIVVIAEDCHVICETNYICAYAHLQINVNVSPSILQNIRGTAFCTLTCHQITDLFSSQCFKLVIPSP
jgi:hypothetical protein